ncbi:thrombospondin-4 [Culex quinquefasciatus]|uniref:Thrombospondin-4 n=1 Tax=Culex quinquefasciatus TaxID=7176 RepID=B0XAV4_CULQU|nr:thrombospondin-4 [Culex quinquefasciatus]|eukprot:XP_001866776.1 thrombospondin-4 [Culex quinquefasciatus]
MFFPAIVVIFATQAIVASGFEERQYGDLRDWYLDNIHIANSNYNYSELKVFRPGMDKPIRQCDERYGKLFKEVEFLRNLMSKCTGCVGRLLNPAPNADGCYAGVCYKDVTCTCPVGYDGDGFSCSKRNACDKTPCFAGVRCNQKGDFPYYECGSCPAGYEGNGTVCNQLDVCAKKPCYRGVDCQWIKDSPYYKCGPCPSGYEGDGRNCSKVDFCAKQPCFPNVNCSWKDSAPYFKCGSCPAGYEGDGIRCGRNPCLQNPCFKGVSCQKKAVDPYFSCGPCPPGLAGNGIVCGKDSDSDGYPDEGLNCKEPTCTRDNCKVQPNSGQEDTNRNGIGDACEDDIDSDGVRNDVDNCPKKFNPRQKDSDGDGVGDECDNCARVRNINQMDTDRDGMGDICDDDIDGDGKRNSADNCPKAYNPKQEDTDRDGVGDLCDNCPKKYNPNQRDSDGDEVGDVCSSKSDSDGDGRQDDRDNCPRVANPGQLDTDEDGVGDACDPDKDNDGVLNQVDNCELIWNPNQADRDRDGLGDVCDTDFDGDGAEDWRDNCPRNGQIRRSDFSNFSRVALDPEGTSQLDPEWEVLNNGAEIFQKHNSDPGLAIGNDKVEGLDFEGTFFVKSGAGDDDFVGFVFGYVSNRKFYFASWKRQAQTYWKSHPFKATATAGVLLKLVNSQTGPGTMLRNSLWNDATKQGQTKLLWQDRAKKGWQFNTAYRWKLLHRPEVGLIRFRLFRGQVLEADSGNLFDFTIKGGWMGVYCFSQALITWSNLKYSCNDEIPRDIYSQLSPETRRKVKPSNNNWLS